MRRLLHILLSMLLAMVSVPALAQRVQFPSSGLRPINGTQVPTTATPVMVPINPATQQGIYPSGMGGQSFDPYAGGAGAIGASQPIGAGQPVLPPSNIISGSGFNSYSGPPPALPGTGQSGTLGTFSPTPPTVNQPGAYPNAAPSALFPGNGNSSFGNFYNGVYNGVAPGGQAGAIQPNYNGTVLPPPYGAPGWNPQGAVFTGNGAYPQFVRLFQGFRFRWAYLYGDNRANALAINDMDVSAAFLWPNFLFSTQPLYIVPSFSLHLWSGPKAPATADLPASAYSAFLDFGWQSDPARLFGAELGVRVGMFTDFNTSISRSLRVMGRGLGRIRITPKATMKLGVIYLGRNRVKLLPAGGILWQPNPQTRFDIFFPEPKLAHYLSTVGNTDTWWYVGGFYGGGSWTIQRADTSKDSIDINDIRLVLGFEWGRNEQMREGRRVGFFEFGYVFNRELLYRESPMDNLDLQDTIMFRAGFGY